MNKFFNHKKRSWRNAGSRGEDMREEYEESDFDWDSDEAESAGDENYAGDGEYYAGDESYAGDGENYAGYSENYVGDGEYYAGDESYAGGSEYYVGDESYAGDGEYYAGDENYAGDGEYYVGDESYAGDGENYVGDESYAGDGENYAGDESYAGDGEYYAGDESYVGNGEYYAGDEGYVGDGEIIYEDEELYNAEYRGEENRRSGRKAKTSGGLLKKIADMPVMDRVIALTGVAVLVLALVTGGYLLSSRIVANQVSGFVSVGAQMEGIDLIGGDALVAVADAEIARLAAANLAQEQEQEQEQEQGEQKDTPGYEENDYSRQVSVELNMTSIQKDLKIKFTNKKSGKLVANVPFSVTVTDPDGKTSIWSDDDMDGIIHKKDIAAGTYKVAMEELTDEKYENYSISTAVQRAEVKKDISYEKVDVANEVKTEAEVDAKKEDTSYAQKDTSVESALQDTVAWVESTSTGISYKEVPKSTIPDPLTILTASRSLDKSFLRMELRSSAVTVSSSVQGAIPVGGTAQLSASPGISNITGDAGEKITNVTVKEGTVSWTSLKAEVATVDASGKVTGIAPGEAVIQYAATAEVTTEEKADPSVSGGNAAPPAKTTDIQVSGQITVQVGDGIPLTPGTLTVDKSAVTVVVNGVAEVQASTRDFAAGKLLAYTAVSDKPGVAAAAVDAAGKVTVTGLAPGMANITVTANYAENGTEATASRAVIAVTVGANKTIGLGSTATLAYVASPQIINATVKGVTTTAPVVSAVSSDTTVMKASVGALKAENGTITAPITMEFLKEGSATLTVKCLENGEEVSATCVVTVKTNPREDKVTALKDSSGNLLFVMEGDKYRQAVYADYYTFDKFYVQGDMKYTGWQTLNGHVYYYSAEGKAVTGEQIIQGAKYTFASDGSLVTGNGALGIDVSKWNGSIDWNAVKNSGVNYVIIRCGYRGSSQGALIEDPKFQTNIKGATAAGLKVGVYFFTQAVDEPEAVEEASMVLGLIRNYKISYPVFLDVESSGGRADSISKEMRTAVCKAFCETIRKEGYTAGIYANKTWLEKRMDAASLSAYKIWLAQYAESPTYTGRYDLWQYRSTGKVSGISGNVDMNLSYLGY